jgi:LmbE family N-acetylglucosaminyl deacetylase
LVATRKKGNATRTRAQKRLACVFAHPDDETFATGGLIAKYAAQGVRVSLFCATPGDAGKSSGVPVASREELGELRRNELLTAARFLGISDVELKDYRDGSLANADPEQLIGDIVLSIRRWRPHVVVTFGPDGAPTGHRDHRAISRAATAAFFLAGVRTAYTDQLRELEPYRPSRLFYVAWRGEITSPRGTFASVPATARIDVRPFLREQMGAFLLHVTQRNQMEPFRETALVKQEYFALAAGTSQRRPMIDDLFDGLRLTR